MTCSCSATDNVPLDDFLPYVLPHIGDVPDEIAAHNVRLAAIEMARVTKQLKRTLFVDAQAGVQNYYLCVPDGYAFLLIDYVACGGVVLDVNRSPNPFTLRDACRTWYAFDKPSTLYINPSPAGDTARAIEVRVVVTPGQDTCYLDRCMYDTHAEDIAHGALYRMFSMRDTDWYSVTDYKLHYREWRDALRRSTVASFKQGSAAPLTMQVPRFV